MFILKKSIHSQSVKVILDGEEIDQIYYENIDDLCSILKKYYSEYLINSKIF